MKKKVISMIMSALLVVACAGCGSSAGGSQNAAAPSTQASAQATEQASEQQPSGEKASINIAYQYGLAYAPLIICQSNGLIEKAYEEATGNQVEVTWTQMSSGADINTGIASGDIQVGFMGVAPAINGVSKGVGYKIFTSLSGQEHRLMSNNAEINSLGDLVGSDKQIALVNIGSIQHIILAKSLSENGFDPHALDANIVAMKHPDGMSALETGSVACHLTSNPYIYKEETNPDLHEIKEISNTWSGDDSFIVGVASETLYDENPALYQALCDAVSDGIDFINGNIEEAAKITCEYNGNTPEDEVLYLGKGVYSSKTKGVFELAQFMADNSFIDNKLENYSDIVFDNVQGD